MRSNKVKFGAEVRKHPEKYLHRSPSLEYPGFDWLMKTLILVTFQTRFHLSFIPAFSVHQPTVRYHSYCISKFQIIRNEFQYLFINQKQTSSWSLPVPGKSKLLMARNTILSSWSTSSSVLPSSMQNLKHHWVIWKILESQQELNKINKEKVD